MAYTQADVEALKRAIATGVQKVTYADGKSHEYRSLAQMREILRMMEAEIAGPSAPPEPRSVLVRHNRDW